MKKTKLTAIALVTLLLSLVTTNTLADGRLIYSPDTGQGITGNMGNVGTPLKQNYDVAMRIADKKFTGMTIAAIRVPMGQMKNVSNLRVWLSKELKLETVNGKKTNMPDILTQPAEVGADWVVVELEKPYTLTDEGVYVGYSFDMDELDETNKRPVRITTELHEGGLYLHTSRSYRNWTDVSDQCSSAMQVELEGAPQYAATPLAGSTTYFGATGIENYVTFFVENHGASGLKSIDYTFDYDGQTLTGTSSFSPAIEPIYGKTTNFEVKLPVVEQKAYYPINLRITKVNGNDNDEASQNMETQISIFDKLPKHRALLEEYTGTWCGFCPRGYVGLAAMNRLHPDDFIALSYHNSESERNPDPMEVMAGQDFPSQISGFPSAWLDRSYEVDAYGGFQSSSPSLGVEDVWKSVCALLAEADIDVKAELSDNQQAVTATATIHFPLEIQNARYGVEYVLVADGLTGTTKNWMQHNYYANGRQGTDFTEPEFKQFVEGDTYVSGLAFDDVAIATTRLTGDNQYLPEQIEEDRAYDLTATFDLSKVRNTQGEAIIQDVNKLRVVALLIDYNDRSVVNAAKSKQLGEATAVTNTSATTNLTQPAAIYDLAGRRLSAMQKGLNIVKRADGSTQKIVIR